VILAVIQFFFDLTGRTKSKDEGLVFGPEVPKDVAYSRTVNICAWTIGYFIAIWLLGFSLAVPATTLLYLKFAGKEKWPITLALSAIGWLFFYGLFVYFLNVPFPEGAIFAWLGMTV
jgi:hypothetical protein